MSTLYEIEDTVLGCLRGETATEILDRFTLQIIRNAEETLALMAVSGVSITKDVLDKMLDNAKKAIEGASHEYTL